MNREMPPKINNEDITQEAYETFKKEKIVSVDIIENIANKMVSDIPLSDKENEIFTEKQTEILSVFEQLALDIASHQESQKNELARIKEEESKSASVDNAAENLTPLVFDTEEDRQKIIEEKRKSILDTVSLHDKEVRNFSYFSDSEKKEILNKQAIRREQKTEKERKTQELLHDSIEGNRESLAFRDADIEEKREAFLLEHKQAIKNRSFLKKTIGKFNNLFPIRHKENTFHKSKEIIDAELEYIDHKNKRSGLVQSRFVDQAIRSRNGEHGKELWTSEDFQKLNEKYNKLVNKSTEEKILNFKNEDLQFVKKENELLRIAKEKNWEENKSKAEKVLQKSVAYLQEKKLFKYTIGSKWFRFAATTGAVGLATGGFSTLFLVNRIARFGGGIVGGSVSKFALNKLWNEEKMLAKRLAVLDERYQKGEIDPSEYDDLREDIDVTLARYARLKQVLTIGSAIGGGFAAGAAETHLAHHAGSPAESTEAKQPDNSTKTIEDKTETTEVKHEPAPEKIVDTKPAATEVHKDTVVEKPVETKIADTTATKAAVENQPDTTNTVEPAPVETEIQKDWIIQKSEGVTHALARQIEHSETLAEKLGWDGKTDLHSFAIEHAKTIATQEGYISEHGERWVYNIDKHDVAYELHDEGDGTFSVREYVDGKHVDLIDETNDTFENPADKVNGDTYEKLHSFNHHGNTHGGEAMNESEYTEPDEMVINENGENGNDLLPRATEIQKGDLPVEPIVIKGDLPPEQPVVIKGDLPPEHPSTGETQKIPAPRTIGNQGGYEAPKIYNPDVPHPGPNNPYQKIGDVVNRQLRNQDHSVSQNMNGGGGGWDFLEMLFGGIIGKM